MVKSINKGLTVVFNNYGGCNNCEHKLCCKINPPVILSNEIQRIARFKKMKDDEFIENYLLEYNFIYNTGEVVNDYILNQIPCPFLDGNNQCSIYPVRPFVCKSYPFEGNIEEVKLEGIESCPTAALIASEVWEFDQEKRKNIPKEVMDKILKRQDEIEESSKDVKNAILDPLEAIYEKMDIKDIVDQTYSDRYPSNLWSQFVKKRKII